LKAVFLKNELVGGVPNFANSHVNLNVDFGVATHEVKIVSSLLKLAREGMTHVSDSRELDFLEHVLNNDIVD